MKFALAHWIHAEKGMTLMETIVVLAIMSVLIPAAALWNRGLSHLSGKQYATSESNQQAWQGYAFMRSEIHDGKNFSVSANGAELNFINGSGEQITYRCNLLKQILRQLNGKGASVIANNVQTLKFSLDPRGKGITIVMTTQVGQTTRTWKGFVAGRDG